MFIAHAPAGYLLYHKSNSGALIRSGFNNTAPSTSIDITHRWPVGVPVQAGTYVFQLTVGDGHDTGTGNIIVEVAPVPSLRNGNGGSGCSIGAPASE